MTSFNFKFITPEKTNPKPPVHKLFPRASLNVNQKAISINQLAYDMFPITPVGPVEFVAVGYDADNKVVALMPVNADDPQKIKLYIMKGKRAKSYRIVIRHLLNTFPEIESKQKIQVIWSEEYKSLLISLK